LHFDDLVVDSFVCSFAWFRATLRSLLDTLVLLAGGLGLVACSLRPHRGDDD
jgi:hypothetical protein